MMRTGDPRHRVPGEGLEQVPGRGDPQGNTSSWVYVDASDAGLGFGGRRASEGHGELRHQPRCEDFSSQVGGGGNGSINYKHVSKFKCPSTSRRGEKYEKMQELKDLVRVRLQVWLSSHFAGLCGG